MELYYMDYRFMHIFIYEFGYDTQKYIWDIPY